MTRNKGRRCKIVCPDDHRLAEVVARSEGLVLRVSSVRLFDLDPKAATGYRAENGDPSERLLLDDPVYGSDGLTVSCKKCGNDYHLLPERISAEIKAGKDRLRVDPRRMRPKSP